MGDVVLPNAAEAEAESQANVSTEAGAAASAAPAPQEETFYDATKVPEALRPSFLEMQKAWTQKTQTVAPLVKLAEEFGGADQLSQFLGGLQSQDGMLELWANIGQELGLLDENTLSSLLGSEDGATPAPVEGQPNPSNDPNSPMTRAEFQQWQRHQETQASQQREDQEVEAAIQSLNLTDPKEERALIALALEFADTMPPVDAIKRAAEEWTKFLDSKVAAVTATRKQKADATPEPLGGTSPNQGEEPPKTWKDADAKARQLYLQREGSNF